MKSFNLDNSLGYYFSKSYKLFSRAFDKQLSDKGLQYNSYHWTLLIILKNNPGINQSVISDIIERDKPFVTRLIDFSEKESLVERKPDPKDRRAHNLYLTAKGKKLFEKLLFEAEILNSEVVKGIDKEHINIMKGTLQKIIEKMSNS